MDRYSHSKFESPIVEKIFTPFITTFLVLSIVGLVLMQTKAATFIQEWFVLNPYYLIRGRIWQLITYPFVGRSPIFLLFDCLVMIILGSAVEREWRGRSFLGLWLVVTVVNGLIWTAVCLLFGKPYFMAGLGAPVFGMIGAFGVLFRGRKFLWFLAVIEAQTLALILVGLGVVLSINPPINLIQLLGAPIAYGYIKLVWWLRSQGDDDSGYQSDFQPSSFVDID